MELSIGLEVILMISCMILVILGIMLYIPLNIMVITLNWLMLISIFSVKCVLLKELFLWMALMKLVHNNTLNNSSMYHIITKRLKVDLSNPYLWPYRLGHLKESHTHITKE